MKKTLIVLLALLILTLGTGCAQVQPTAGSGETKSSDAQPNKPATYQDLSAQQLKDMLANSERQLVDVREPNEFQEGYITGAVNIPLGQLSSNVDKISKDKPVVVYCRSGRRSVSAAKFLLEQGYEQVYNLKGGILDWNFGLEKPQASLSRYNSSLMAA